jgi:hypothetical protein
MCLRVRQCPAGHHDKKLLSSLAWQVSTVHRISTLRLCDCCCPFAVVDVVFPPKDRRGERKACEPRYKYLTDVKTVATVGDKMGYGDSKSLGQVDKVGGIRRSRKGKITAKRSPSSQFLYLKTCCPTRRDFPRRQREFGILKSQNGKNVEKKVDIHQPMSRTLNFNC